MQDIDDILTDDDSVDYSAPQQQPLEPQVQVQNNNQQPSDSDEANNSTPESAMDSSLDMSSIEVIQPHEGLEIRLPINLPQRALPNSPESPRTNVTVPIPDGLLTDNEETGGQVVPPTVLTPTRCTVIKVPHPKREGGPVLLLQNYPHPLSLRGTGTYHFPTPLNT